MSVANNAFRLNLYSPPPLPILFATLHHQRMIQVTSEALEEVLAAARRRNCFAVGLHQCVKGLEEDPHNVFLCVIFTEHGENENYSDSELQRFCFQQRVLVLRVAGMRERAAQLLATTSGDLRCILIRRPEMRPLPPQQTVRLRRFCEENSRGGAVALLQYSPRVYS
ncbi:growth arrest and DNA damage-inducible protein GADD45 beta-like [Pholidichthys leucotaenia]